MAALSAAIGPADLLQRATSGAAIEFRGLLADVETAAQAREERLLQSEIAAKRIDSRDAKLRREIEKIPTKRLGTRERAARENPHAKVDR